MSTARLVRQASTPHGTFGRMTVGDQSWFTVERQWLDNQSDISCIPVGVYRCQMTWSPRFKTMLYELSGVPNRFAVRIHAANLARQLNGCIALGRKRGTMDGVPCVLVSKPAVWDFQTALGRQPFTLEIVNA